MGTWLFKSEPSTYSFDDLVRDGMMLLKRGARLSVQPVTEAELRTVLGLRGLAPDDL